MLGNLIAKWAQHFPPQLAAFHRNLLTRALALFATEEDMKNMKKVRFVFGIRIPELLPSTGTLASPA